MTTIQLTECPRVQDGHLKWPRWNCRDCHRGMCEYWPGLMPRCFRYVNEHPGVNMFSIQFRCVLCGGGE